MPFVETGHRTMRIAEKTQAKAILIQAIRASRLTSPAILEVVDEAFRSRRRLRELDRRSRRPGPLET